MASTMRASRPAEAEVLSMIRFDAGGTTGGSEPDEVKANPVQEYNVEQASVLRSVENLTLFFSATAFSRAL